MTIEIITEQLKHNLEVTNATFMTESVLNSMRTINVLNDGGLNTTTLLEQLHKQVDKVIDGDTRRIETMLMTQAQTLDVFFHQMMRTSMRSELIPQLQAYVELGFKAQNQCRKALLALAEIKNPKKATFIKQQNNAVNQQVNNGIKKENLKKSENITNELLSEVTNEALDDGRESSTININSPVETLVESGSEN